MQGDSLPSASAREKPGVRAASFFSGAASRVSKPPNPHSPVPNPPAPAAQSSGGPLQSALAGMCLRVPGPRALRFIPGAPSPRSHCPRCPSAQTSPTAERPGAPAAFPPQSAAATPARARRPQGGNKSVSAATEVPQSGTPPPRPSPTSPRVAPRSASQGAAPARETLRTCPGSPDSGCGGEGSPRTELRRPGTIEGGRAALWPCSGRGGVGGLPLPRAHPRPLAPAGAHALTLRVGRLCAAGCRCSHFLFLPPAGRGRGVHLQGIPRPAASSPPEPPLRGGRCRPGTCAWTRAGGAFAPCPRPAACPPHFVPGAGVGAIRGQCPRLFEVPPLIKKKMSNTVPASDLL